LAKKLSLRAAADESGISFNTLARVERGHVPDLDSFVRIAKWLGRSPADFLGERAVIPGHTPDVIEAHLRGDPALSEAATAVIAGMVREFYGKLSEPRHVTACHLRAATTFKPQASTLLAEILMEMRESLSAGE
jgi:transcriptional regulator with XRE-family HTH domain